VRLYDINLDNDFAERGLMKELAKSGLFGSFKRFGDTSHVFL